MYPRLLVVVTFAVLELDIIFASTPCFPPCAVCTGARLSHDVATSICNIPRAQCLIPRKKQTRLLSLASKTSNMVAHFQATCLTFTTNTVPAGRYWHLYDSLYTSPCVCGPLLT